MAAPTPLTAYAFRVSVDSESAGFAEVSGLRLEREVLRYRHGLSYAGGERIITVPSRGYVELTLRRGVIAGRGQLHAWLVDASAAARALTVTLIDADERAAATWRIARAIPVKLVAPTLDAKSGEVAVESLELLASGLSYETAA